MRFIFLTFILISFSFPINAQSLTDSLKIHLELDGNLMDSSGNNYHFLGNGNLNYIPFYHQDSAISFNGTNGASMISNFINISNLNEIAICFWFKANHSSQNDQVLIQGANMGTSIYIDPSNDLVGGSFQTPVSSNSIFDTISRLDNKWHHITFQNNGNTTFLYVDGKLINQSIQQIFGNATNRYHIGKTSLNTKYFTGSMNDFRVYSRILSQVEINTLSQLPFFYDTISPILCEPLTSPSGKYKWNQTGTYFDTTENASGFKTIHTVNLFITPIEDSISFSNNTLRSHESNAIYQWLDCNNNYSRISGATNSTFIPNQNGDYALEITKGTCKDTSACETVLLVGELEQNQIEKSVKLYPNPTNNEFKIDLGKHYKDVDIQLLDINGKLINKNIIFHNEKIIHVRLSLNSGVYLLRLTIEKSKTIHKKLFIK